MTKRTSHSLVQTLRSIPDFASLEEPQLLEMAGESMNLCWRAGSAIFNTGEPGEALYVIIDGECSIVDNDGLEVAHPKPGDSFGEMSLLMDTTHNRSAIASTDCEILVLPKVAFARLIRANPNLGAHFDGVLESRSSSASE